MKGEGLSRSWKESKKAPIAGSKARSSLLESSLGVRMADTQQGGRENGVHSVGTSGKRKQSSVVGDASTPALLKKMKMESDAPPEVRFCALVVVWIGLDMALLSG